MWKNNYCKTNAIRTHVEKLRNHYGKIILKVISGNIYQFFEKRPLCVNLTFS